MKNCSIDSCSNPSVTKGLCHKHYKRLLTHGDPNKTLQVDCKGSLCSEQDCDRPARKRLLCGSHYTKLWRAEQPEKAYRNIVQSWKNRNARKRGATGSHMLAEWTSLLKTHDGLCAYCKTAEANTKDHIVPISKGGTDYIDNILPACRSCNARKWVKSYDEFTRSLA